MALRVRLLIILRQYYYKSMLSLLGDQGLPGEIGRQGLPGLDGVPGRPGRDGLPGKTRKNSFRQQNSFSDFSIKASREPVLKENLALMVLTAKRVTKVKLVLGEFKVIRRIVHQSMCQPS